MPHASWWRLRHELRQLAATQAGPREHAAYQVSTHLSPVLAALPGCPEGGLSCYRVGALNFSDVPD